MKQHKMIIADDDRELADLLAIRCRSIGIDVQLAFDAFTALDLIRSEQPDVVCLDVNMPGGNGLGVCEMLASDPECNSIPVVILTGQSNEDTIRRCHDLCAFHVPKGADSWRRLKPLLCDILNLNSASLTPPPENEISNQEFETMIDNEPVERADRVLEAIFSSLETDDNFLDGVMPRTAENESPIGYKQADADEPVAITPWLLHVDDDETLSRALKIRLEGYGVSVVNAFSGMDGVKQAMTHPADAILLDFEMPQGSGDYVLRRLKSSPLTENTPVIFLTGKKNATLSHQLKNLGAAEVLHKPIDFPRLLDALSRHMPIPTNIAT